MATRISTAVHVAHAYTIDLSGLTGGPLSVKYGTQTVVDAVLGAQ